MRIAVFFISLFTLGFICLDGNAATFETKAKQVIILDYETGAELYSKDADTPMQPASMTKMMTALLVADLHDQIHMQTPERRFDCSYWNLLDLPEIARTQAEVFCNILYIRFVGKPVLQ